MSRLSEAYRRQVDRDDHKKDLIQPYHNGKPNPEFIRAYKKQATEYFTEEELIKYQE